ncbi:hypothetical protein VFPPC_17100 [Pochonia chlamydosporia 170]|uniref:Uncharacterized protein n=1 Tax=Pochonia chlamydosporia 170 TaxID=1380566 RepID=A0A179EX04_METCM|nr:hypothetical protein VFPPC_17100 [Pochonia chlamydosporia 170]OAQ57735.2 hypothetical protein VFPPC_17100 [Pochonia chlamydosporia 170]
MLLIVSKCFSPSTSRRSSSASLFIDSTAPDGHHRAWRRTTGNSAT